MDSQMLTKITVEATLNVDPDEHLGYNKHNASKASDFKSS